MTKFFGFVAFLAAALAFSTGAAWAANVDLSTLTAAYTAQNGDVLTGTLGKQIKISIAADATVTLDGVNINGSRTWTSGKYAGITCLGDATIVLEGENTVTGFYQRYPGIYVPKDKTLTIKGSGSLTASCSGTDSGGGAGIGGGYQIACGNIVIESGTITANGVVASGIGGGGGTGSTCGDITITGGDITANGGRWASGIGSGYKGQCGNIKITGGAVTATGGLYGAGIGSGNTGDNTTSTCGNIEITGGAVTATGGEHSAGIGSGFYGTCGSITITDDGKATEVTATKSGNAPHSIGSGQGGTCGDVSVNGENGPITTNPYTYKHVKSVTLDKTSVTITEGETVRLTAAVEPSDATVKDVTWSSSNPSIVTINASSDVTADVTALAGGTATITVTTKDGGKTAACAVTVKVPVTGVTLDITSADITVGETVTLTATVAPDNATDKSVTWSSSNTSVATVSESGVVTAVAAGTATITVTTTDEGKTAECAVTVRAATVPVTGVTLNKTSTTITVGRTETLTATVAPDNATDKGVTWSSSNTFVATVSSSGVVTAVASGSATITVTTTDGNKTAECAVTVRTASSNTNNGTTNDTPATDPTPQNPEDNASNPEETPESPEETPELTPEQQAEQQAVEEKAEEALETVQNSENLNGTEAGDTLKNILSSALTDSSEEGTKTQEAASDVVDALESLADVVDVNGLSAGEVQATVENRKDLLDAEAYESENGGAVRDTTAPVGSELLASENVSDAAKTLNEALTTQPKVIEPTEAEEEDVDAARTALSNMTGEEKSAAGVPDDFSTEELVLGVEFAGAEDGGAVGLTVSDQASQIEELLRDVVSELIRLRQVLASLIPDVTAQTTGYQMMRMNLGHMIPGQSLSFSTRGGSARGSVVVAEGEDSRIGTCLFFDESGKPVTKVTGDASKMMIAPYLVAGQTLEGAYITTSATEKDVEALSAYAAAAEDTETLEDMGGSHSGCDGGFAPSVLALAALVLLRKVKR